MSRAYGLVTLGYLIFNKKQANISPKSTWQAFKSIPRGGTGENEMHEVISEGEGGERCNDAAAPFRP